MNVWFHESAESEFLSAVEYYETKQRGLGLRFSREIYDTIQRICDYPMAWEYLDDEFRRCLGARFPYGVIYRVVENSIQIMAVMHLNRKPGYFSDRSF